MQNIQSKKNRYMSHTKDMWRLFTKGGSNLKGKRKLVGIALASVAISTAVLADIAIATKYIITEPVKLGVRFAKDVRKKSKTPSSREIK